MTETPRVLAESNNAIVDLAPAPVVARVATTIAAVREQAGAVHARREVEIAGWLAERGGPVGPPCRSIPPGPHHCDQFMAWLDRDERRRPSR